MIFHSRKLAAAVATAFAGVVLLAGAATASAAGPYTIQHTWKIGGEGRWDYLAVDSANHLLYIVRLNEVQVIDTNDGKVVKEITGLKHGHGVVFDADGKFGYISDGGGNEVLVFDRTSYDIVAHIPTGKNPDGMVFEPTTKTVWAFEGGGKKADVIDTSTNKIVASLPTGGTPEFPVADGKGMVYDNNEDLNVIEKFDAKSMKMTGQWSVLPCKEPSGLAMDTANRRLFSVCDGTMVVSDADAGKVVTTVPVGDGPDAVKYDAKAHMIFASNEDGTLSIIEQRSADKYVVLQKIKTMEGSKTMGFDHGTGVAYVAGAVFGTTPPKTAANPKPRPVPTPSSVVMFVVGK